MTLRHVVPLIVIVFSGCYCQPSPNGKSGELQFIGAVEHQPCGAESRIIIPERIFLEGRSGKFDLSIPYDAQLDFTDTTLETDAAEGLELLEVAQLENRDYRIRMLCKADATMPAELAVKIKRDGRVQYEDAIDFFCYRQTRTWSAQDGEAWVTDSRFDLLVRQQDDRDGGISLTTHYVSLAQDGGFALAYDGGAPDNVYTGQPLPIHTLSATTALAIRSGEFTAALPIRVLADDQWELRLSVVQREDLYFQLKAHGVAGDITDVQGIKDCQFRSVDVGGNGSQQGPVANCQHGALLGNFPERACMTFRDRTSCLLLHLDGGSEAVDGGF